LGNRRLTGSDWPQFSARLSLLSQPEDRVIGLTCYSPTPKATFELGHKLVDALNQADRAVVIYPTLHPWLAATRIVRDANGRHRLPKVDRPLEVALQQLGRCRQLVFPVSGQLVQRMLARDAEFTSMPASTLRRQLAHFLDHIIDELGVAVPIVSDSAHALFLAFNSQVRTTVLIDDTRLVMVLMNGSVQWVEAGASDDAEQLVGQTATRVERLLATAVDPDGRNTFYAAHERCFGRRDCEVMR
jgi:hypothetical protein